MSTGPIGFIYHCSSGKLVHPYGGSHKPADNTALVLYDGKDDPSRLQMRFVAEHGEGHFGYIEHVSSGKVVHPCGGSLNPGENTCLVLHSDRHHAALFQFNEFDKTLIHKGGKAWHPSGGSPNPANNTYCVLHSTRHSAAQFYFGDINGVPMSPYSSVKLTGNWKVLKAFITPKATHKYKVNYKTGRSLTPISEYEYAWSLPEVAAYKMFKATAEYFGFVEKSDSNTWGEEKDETKEITVEKGKTVVVWQYVFKAEQLGDECSYFSTIIGDTHSLDIEPKLNLET